MLLHDISKVEQPSPWESIRHRPTEAYIGAPLRHHLQLAVDRLFGSFWIETGLYTVMDQTLSVIQIVTVMG